MASQEDPSARKIRFAARVRIGWGDVPLALALLVERAEGTYAPGPIGNAVCIDFASQAGALMILDAFVHSRKIAPDRD